MKNLIVLFAVLFTVNLRGVAESAGETCTCFQGVCPLHWYQYKQSCFMPVMKQMSWAEAELSCQTIYPGSHLASIHSPEENDYIFALMGRLQDYRKKEAYWIGAHDMFKEGYYVWTDGTEMDFMKFGTGQPDNAGGAENFIGSWAIKDGSVTWNDYPYSSLYFFPFVCKMTIKNC